MADLAASSKPVAMKKPDKAEHLAQVETLQSEINTLQEKARQAKLAMDKLISDRSGSRGEVDAARQTMQNLMAERKLKTVERNDITSQRDASRDRLTVLQNQEKSLRAEMKFSTIDEIDRQIRDLEQRQARTTMSLNDEKKIIKDINSLRQSKKSVSAIGDIKENIEKEKTNRTLLDKRITDKNIELKAINERIDVAKAELDALNKDNADKDQIPALRRTQQDCREQIQVKFDSVRALKTEFKKKEEDYNKYLNEVNAKKREARKIEEEKRKKEQEEEKRKEEEEELKRIPYEEEIKLCEHLITYLTTNFASQSEANEATGTDSAPAVTAAFAGMKLVTREEETFGGAAATVKKSRGKKKGGNNAKKDTINHAIDTLDFFSLLQISPPTNVSQVAVAVEALNEKKSTFQSSERGSIPTLAEIRKSRAAGRASSSSSGRGGFNLEADFPSLAGPL